MTNVVLQLLWVAAHHGLRQRCSARDPQDTASCPRATWDARMWNHVHDITKELGHPPAPSKWAVRR